MEGCLVLFLKEKKQETVEFHLPSCYQPIKTILQYLKKARLREQVAGIAASEIMMCLRCGAMHRL